MIDSIDLKLTGVDELVARLEALGPKLARRAMRRALKAAGEVIADTARDECPVLPANAPNGRRPGELRDSIDAVVTLSSDGQRGTVKIGPTYDKADGNQSPGVYGTFVELGSVHNPHPQPFMRPAFDTEADEALAKISEVLKEELDAAGSN